MNSSSSEAADMSESLLRLSESAPQVMRRPQFFQWSQGDLQRWLPHKLLVCGAYERQDRDLHFSVFNSLPLPEAVLNAMRNRVHPLMARLLQQWRLGRMRATRVVLSPWTQAADASLEQAQELVSAGYKELLVHGLCRPGRPSEIETMFVLGVPGHEYTAQEVSAFDMLLPTLHMTYLRVHLTEREMESAASGGTAKVASSGSSQKSITARESEILCWVRDGMSNQQIAEKLGISSLTVKNHIQKILRKLGAANRTQAVTMAMSMNALRGAHDA